MSNRDEDRIAELEAQLAEARKPSPDLEGLAEESERLAKDIPERHEKGLAEEFFLTTGEIFGRHAAALRFHRCSGLSEEDREWLRTTAKACSELHAAQASKAEARGFRASPIWGKRAARLRSIAEEGQG